MKSKPKGDKTNSADLIHTFDLLDNNYLIIEVNGYRLLLNTGCPFSFRLSTGPDELELLGGRLRPRTMPFRENNPEEGFGILGIRVDVVVGMNVLGWFAWEVDRVAGTIRATPASPEAFGGVWLPLNAQDGPPLLTLDDGTKAILDSGTSVSYRIGGHPAAALPVDMVTTWSTVWGKMVTPVWETSIQIGGLGLPVRYGRLSAEADSMLKWMVMGWIIGADLFRAFRVSLDFPNGRLGLQPLDSTPAQENARA